MLTLRPYQRSALDAPFRGRFVNHVGKRFGRWVVISYAGSKQGRGARWLCRCDCGTQKVVPAESLVRGKSKSCGCATNIFRSASCTKHGQSRKGNGGKPTATYSSWHGMRQRCENPNAQYYRDYGGRGIQVCERWKDFRNFLADMGECPSGQTLERKEVNGNYEPSNCKWATRKEQTQIAVRTLAIIKSLILSQRHGL